MVSIVRMSEEHDCAELLYWFAVSAPTYSLVVPAEESHRRNVMCECLDVVYPGSLKCLLVNVEKGIVVHGGLDSMSCLTEHLQKLQKESSLDWLRSSERVFKMLWPVFPEEQGNPFPGRGSCPITNKLNGVKLEYGDHIDKMVHESKMFSPIKIGQSFDVIPFLSGQDDTNYLHRNDGETERVEVNEQMFSGKYILVCCFGLPLFRQEREARDAQAIATACSELYSMRSDFEMVVVAKMNPLANSEGFFNHFLSGFPTSCLEVRANDRLWWNGALPPSKLEDLLGCNPSDVLYKTVSPGIHEKVTMSELSSKVVGVYMCIQGHFIPTLGKVYQQCRAQGLDFEIVLVCVPWIADSLDPEVHIANIERVLLEWNISWCWLPPAFGCPNKLFNSSVSSRVRRCIDEHFRDQILIVGPHGTFVEPYGAEIMSLCGTDAYPFGRDGFFEMELKKFEKLTLESLLVYGPRDYVYRDNKKVDVRELRGKKILVYLDILVDYNLALQMNYWLYEMKQYCDPDVEVVLVRRHGTRETGDEADLRLSGFAPLWYVCPFDPQHSTSLEEELFIGGLKNNAVVAFGTDGRVSSLGALGRLVMFGAKGVRFDRSDLRQDVFEHLELQGRMMFAGPGWEEWWNFDPF
ncbi:unnamed protein product [Cuscuta campestris]|uniref:Uncharacterized protein n=1 Tax=Cuscuta campestris TaxID=132261 RepID=A0A484MFI1_9ASTE|nr:unnamed protein product [Cuscuta campestris]